MLKRRSSAIDRRSGEDRRRVYDLDYFSNGGVERRNWRERRSLIERRMGWLRVDKWFSVSKKDLSPEGTWNGQAVHIIAYLRWNHFPTPYPKGEGIWQRRGVQVLIGVLEKTGARHLALTGFFSGELKEEGLWKNKDRLLSGEWGGSGWISGPACSLKI